MKIKKNELVIVFVLVYVFVIICGWNFLIKPQNEKAAELSVVLSEKQSAKSATDIKIQGIDTVKKDIDAAIEKLNKTSDKLFPYNNNPELHVDNIDNYENNANVKLISLELNQLASEDLADQYKQPQATTVPTTVAAVETTTVASGDDATDGASAQPTTVAPTAEPKEDKYTKAETLSLSITTATVTVRGSMAQVIEFANKIQEVNKTIEINVVSIIQNEEDNGLYDATYTLNFVSGVDTEAYEEAQALVNAQ